MPRVLSLLPLLLIALLVRAVPARAAACETGTPANVCLLIPDGSSSDDVASSRRRSTSAFW